jgi:hypothetical protein
MTQKPLDHSPRPSLWALLCAAHFCGVASDLMPSSYLGLFRPLLTSLLSHQPLFSLFIVLLSSLLLLLLILKPLEYFLNLYIFPLLLASFPLKVSIKFYPLTISIHDILLPLSLLDTVNKFLHLNCQFDVLNIDLVQVTLLPRIRVLVSGFQMRAYSKSPNDWHPEDIEHELASSRLETIDSLTAAINSKLKSNPLNSSMSLLHLPMHCVDILIATAILEMRSISVRFCAHRSGQPDDTLVEVKLDQLLVNPSGSYTNFLYGPMFQVHLDLFPLIGLH